MYTSFVTLALAGFLAANVPFSAEPIWWRDYSVAQTKGRSEKKPLAVFVGSGAAGYEKITREGGFTDAIKKTLTGNYVCVYLDGQTKSGRSIIQALEIGEHGMVISDHAGGYQVFHHTGLLSQSELARHLLDYSIPASKVRATVTSGVVQANYYQTSSSGYRSGVQSPVRQQGFAPVKSTRSC